MTTISNKWKYQIDIKSQFEDETTPELVVKLCKSLIAQLSKIKESVNKSNLTEDYVYHTDSELEVNIDNFDFLRKLADNTLTKEEWDNYSFYGDFEAEFNGYFEQLYDLADERVFTKNGISEKFMWIN